MFRNAEQKKQTFFLPPYLPEQMSVSEQTKKRQSEKEERNLESDRNCYSATKASNGESPELESQWRQTAVTCMQARPFTCEIELWLKQPDMHVLR